MPAGRKLPSVGKERDRYSPVPAADARPIGRDDGKAMRQPGNADRARLQRIAGLFDMVVVIIGKGPL